MGLAVWQKTAIEASEDPRRYATDILRYATARLGSVEDAEDVTVEVLHSLPSRLRASEPRHFVLGVARRKIANVLRKRKPSIELRETDRSHEPSVGLDRRMMVADTLAKLSDEHREALVLKYVHGLTAQELGKLTGRSPQAVDSLLQRARAAFAQAANGAFDEEH